MNLFKRSKGGPARSAIRAPAAKREAMMGPIRLKLELRLDLKPAHVRGIVPKIIPKLLKDSVVFIVNFIGHSQMSD